MSEIQNCLPRKKEYIGSHISPFYKNVENRVNSRFYLFELTFLSLFFHQGKILKGRVDETH